MTSEPRPPVSVVTQQAARFELRFQLLPQIHGIMPVAVNVAVFQKTIERVSRSGDSGANTRLGGGSELWYIGRIEGEKEEVPGFRCQVSGGRVSGMRAANSGLRRAGCVAKNTARCHCAMTVAASDLNPLTPGPSPPRGRGESGFRFFALVPLAERGGWIPFSSPPLGGEEREILFHLALAALRERESRSDRDR